MFEAARRDYRAEMWKTALLDVPCSLTATNVGRIRKAFRGAVHGD